MWARRMPEARAAAEEALRLDPNRAQAWHLVSSLDHFSGHDEAALELIARADRLDPANRVAHKYTAAQAHYALGQYRRAARLLKQRLAVHTRSDLSRVLLAACYGQLGRVEEAYALWDEALDINSGYTLEHKKQILPYVDSAEFDHFVEGLCMAGIEEALAFAAGGP